MKDLVIKLSDHEIQIIGSLTQSTVVTALAECQALLPYQQEVTINFQQVTTCDSASLALLIALLREAKARQTQLKFNHLPKQMQDLSSVTGIHTLLPIAE